VPFLIGQSDYMFWLWFYNTAQLKTALIARNVSVLLHNLRLFTLSIISGKNIIVIKRGQLTFVS